MTHRALGAARRRGIGQTADSNWLRMAQSGWRPIGAQALRQGMVGCAARWGGWLLAAGILTALYAASPNFAGRDADAATPLGGDFLQEWIGGHLVQSGQMDGLYQVERFDQLQHDERLIGFRWDRAAYLPPVYPPFYYVLVSPLARLDFRKACAAWAALLVTSLVVACRLVAPRLAYEPACASLSKANRFAGGQTASARAIGGEGERGSDAPNLVARTGWLLLAVLSFYPVLEALAGSQKGPLLMLAVLGTYLLLERSRPWAAGMVFGLVACKPQLAWLLPGVMVLCGQWRFVGGMGTTVGLLWGSSFAMSPQAWSDFLAFAGGALEYARTPGYEHHLDRAPSLVGFWALVAGPHSPWLWSLTVASGVLVLLLLARLIAAQPQMVGHKCHWAYTGCMIASCLLSPHLFGYDLAILLVPMWLTARSVSRRVCAGGARRAAWWFVALVYAAPGISIEVARTCGIQLMTLVMMGWLAAVAQWARSSRESESSQAGLESGLV